MIEQMDQRFHSYLRDESRLSGNAMDISFPKTEKEVVSIVRECFANGRSITVQGARTGISGSAVPVKDHVMCLAGMQDPQSLAFDGYDSFLLRVQPGYTLSSLHRDLRSRRFAFCEEDGPHQEALERFMASEELFWPPDPSELTATIGGIAAMNAGGPCAYRYGAAQKHIHAIRVVLEDGNVHTVHNHELTPFLGSEGMLGAITSLTLRLAPKPKEMWGICLFFPEEQQAGNFIDSVRESSLPTLAALDFLDERALAMVGSLKAESASLREIQEPPEGVAAVYMELHAESNQPIEEDAQRLMEWGAEQGSDLDTSWAVSGDSELERLRLFRHAVPESVNTKIDRIRLAYPGAVKMAADMAVPGIPFSKLLRDYRMEIDESDLQAVVFGHGGENHLHINFLPEDDGQKGRGAALLEKWARRCCDAKGRIAVEHGVGKLKKDLFYTDLEKVREMRLLKERFDPCGRWNPGNMLKENAQ